MGSGSSETIDTSFAVSRSMFARNRALSPGSSRHRTSPGWPLLPGRLRITRRAGQRRTDEALDLRSVVSFILDRYDHAR
jgi:hypothetical protein